MRCPPAELGRLPIAPGFTTETASFRGAGLDSVVTTRFTLLTMHSIVETEIAVEDASLAGQVWENPRMAGGLVTNSYGNVNSNSIRRLTRLPAASSLPAMGSAEPAPFAVSRCGSIPRSIR